ncbi:hypothetical protein PIB30_079208 [Stylosanthes scabra]|uniref:DUF4283 domain-containing protein n=1 Tax=Stylosanthes scabra TaxID=79078 RepID=A0ABU6SSA7_9FABA|nr:hypothetical protein [Stylosanthes scabra]
MIGPMKVLLVFRTPEEGEEALAAETMQSLFLELRWCATREANRNQKCWLMVTGLPIHGWTRDNMDRIGRVWGRVIQIEEEEGGHHNFFRVQIVANIGPSICALASVNTNDEDNEVLAVETQKGVAMATEGEESKVGETQPTLRSLGDESCNGARPLGPNAEKEGAGIGPSPTRTKSLHDDRRTEEVIQEWGDVLYQKVTVDQAGPTVGNVSPMGSEEGNGSKDLSAPPGFDMLVQPEDALSDFVCEGSKRIEVVEKKGGGKTKITSLKLKDRLKERARQCKETRKQKKSKLQRITEELEAAQSSSSEEEIEDTDQEVEEIWDTGRRLGLVMHGHH